jgi:hypothetical protein
MNRVSVLAVLFLLAACCPPALQARPTAFRAQVLGTTPAASLLQLRQDVSAPLLSVAVAGASLVAADGTPLELSDFRPGDSVYLRGMVGAGEVRATVVQRLDPNGR